MNSEQKPMSIKDRIAMFQGLVNNSHNPSPAPVIKPTVPKPVPTQVTPSQNISPPVSNNPDKSQGNVQSPSIVKPSAAKQLWQQKSQQNQNQSPKKNIDVPSTKAPEPKKIVQIDSPDIVKPSVARQTWQPSSQPITKNDNFVKILQAANKQTEQPSPAPKQVSPSVNKPIQNKESEGEKSMTQAAIRQMLEGKMASNRQSVPVYTQTNKPKVQKPEVQKEQPNSSTNNQVGSVKSNAKLLNQFFQAQKIKTEQENKKTVQNNEVKPDIVSPLKKPQNIRPISQNIVIQPQAPLSPGLSLPSPGLNTHTSLQPADSPELNMVARLKRKKRTREIFSSDED